MDEAAKKNILRKIPYGLYVVGVRDGESHHAFTGSWFSQCSMKPPRVMLGVRHGTQSLEMIRKGKVFSVNWFSKEDKYILEQFFKPAPSSGNRFGGLTYQIYKTGAPVLDKSISFLECEVVHAHEAGDHTLVIGDVVNAVVRLNEPPLVMSDTTWHYGG